MITKSRLRLISERVPAWRRLLVRELHVDAAESASLVGDPLHLEQMPIYPNKGVEGFLKPKPHRLCAVSPLPAIYFSETIFRRDPLLYLYK